MLNNKNFVITILDEIKMFSVSNVIPVIFLGIPSAKRKTSFSFASKKNASEIDGAVQYKKLTHFAGFRR